MNPRVCDNSITCNLIGKAVCYLEHAHLVGKPMPDPQHHIAGFRLTCAQGCIKPQWFDAGPGGGNAATVEAQARSRRCPRCREAVTVEAIHADETGRIRADAPRDAPGPRRKA